MAVNYAYSYAEIDNATYMCVGVVDTSDPNMAGPTGVGSTYIAIDEYSDDYLFKYYNFDAEKWYYDAGMTEEFVL